MKTVASLFLILAVTAFSGCVYFHTGISTSNYIDSAIYLDKCRTYEYDYDAVFKAAFEAARKSGLKVRVVDKNMGAILADKHLGWFGSGWHESFGIFLKAESDKKTLVQVKYQPYREGLSYTGIGLPMTEKSSSFVSVGWEASSRKVNKIFSNIQQKLGIKDIWGIRGLPWY